MAEEEENQKKRSKFQKEFYSLSRDARKEMVGMLRALQNQGKELTSQLDKQVELNKLRESARLNTENIVKGFVGANDQIVKFQKTLGLSVKDSAKFTRELGFATVGSRNIAVNLQNAAKAVGVLNKGLGTGTKLFKEQAIDVGRFAVTLGLSEKSQQNLAFTSIQQGKSVKDLVKSQIGAVTAVEAEFGTRLDILGAIKEASEVTGQVRAQLAGNLSELTRTVAVTKQFGFELDGIVNSSKSLLDFQSSIEAELEAELLTGKQLNLEQARLFALTGDYAGLTKEIANNVGDFYEFSQLNVLQQDAIAKSVGMTSDQLSDALFKEASISELKEQARADGNEQLLADLERLETQKQLEQITLRIQSAFVSVAATLTPVFEGMALMAENLDLILAAAIGFKAVTLIQLALEKRRTRELTKQLFLDKGRAALAIIRAAVFGPVGLAVVGALTAAAATYAMTRSTGGPVNAGQPYMVGERGPELIVPTNSGMVVSNNQLSSGGGRGRSDSEIVSLATKAAARSISVDFNTPRFNSINSLDAVFA